MDIIREQIYLAALLHDIGKFYQRADVSLGKRCADPSFVQSKEIADYICPLNGNGQFGYQHAIWTHQFLCEIDSLLKKIPGFYDNPFKNSDDSLFKLACYHHKPSTELEALISLADWWSAGIDRREKIEIEDGVGDSDKIDWGKERYKQVPLYSVFNGINAGNYKSAFGLNSLGLDSEAFFPNDVISKTDGVDQKKYKNLWDRFKNEIEDLPTDSFSGFAESMLFLLKKYTWCIPSNTMDMANVSLYDHLKTTAAFADCLYCYKEKHPGDFVFDNTSCRLTLRDGKCPVLLVGGDISGIQKFIYSIASRKASVSLKGRSFYLQLLIDSIIQRIISHEKIQATLAHVVYSSGGKFYMLLPNTDDVKEALDSLRKEFEEDIWEKHFGQLVVNMDFVPFAYDTNSKKICFDEENTHSIGDLWKALADKLAECKNHKFESVILEDYDRLFKPQKCTEKSKVCAVTGIESDSLVVLDPKADDKTFVLESVKEQARLGDNLKDADFILTYRGNGGSTYLRPRIPKGEIEIVESYNYLFDQQELIFDDAEFRKVSSADVCRVKRVNDTEFLATSTLKGKACSYGFQFYGGNKQAQIYDRNKTFEELSDNSYLGVLRMDVDNLGSIFIQGLPDEDKSFSAYSTLSFMLDYFFSGYLNTIRNGNAFRDHVNILYSGGDDIFAIGRWDKLILFAEQIRIDFQKFVGGRRDISISGGIVMVGGKYPISKAALLAGEAEDAAKAFKLDGDVTPRKNAINLFGESICWNGEFDYVKEWKDDLMIHCKQYDMPRSILHRIMTLAAIVRSNKNLKDGMKPDYSYIWHTTYFLTRFKSGKSAEIKSLCDKLSKELLDNRKYELISIAARWAELEMKEFNNNLKDK